MKHRGFTLIEVLLVIAIIAILAGIVLVAINPSRQIAEANNARRSTDVTAILNAISQHAVREGTLPAGITVTPTVIASSGGVNLCTDLVTGGYIAQLPTDPTAAGASWTDCTNYNTGYNVSVANGRITVNAPSAELGETIGVTQ